jgi:D-alanyl-D-alanine carboxypeptidase/D-alanyl-D-alanine-endopeptidase (penicillin-binding protein 4)
MKRKFYYLFVFYFLFAGTEPLAAQLPQALWTFIQDKNLRHAGIGFKAVDLATGETLAAYNEQISLTPASNMKLVTTATVLTVLEKDFRFETPLFYDGNIQNGILEGNLYLQGSGDPTLGSEYFAGDKEAFLLRYLAGIREAGIRSVTGSVIVSDQLFGYDKGVSPQWLYEDLGNYYAPGIYGISVFDNMYRVYLQSYSPGTKTTFLSMNPEIKEISFTNEVVAGETNSDQSFISGFPFASERRLYGSIPANRLSFPLKGDIPDPGLFLAKYFTAYLQKNGIEVRGEGNSARLGAPVPEMQNLLASVQSPTLDSIVRVVNVKSNNHYAEHLFRFLNTVKNADIPSGWEEKGLDASALFMCDGSGLSPLNAVSAGFLTDLLVYMYRTEGASGAFFRSLPLAGQEGTVASFLKNTPLAGKARIKSGSITGVQSYSGYIDKNGKKYAFSLIINHFSGERPTLRKAVEELLNGLF